MAGSPYTFITQTDIGSGGAGLIDTTAPFPAVTVDPATLTVSAAGLTPANKIYDGTDTAVLAIGTPTLVGVINADSVSLVTGGATGVFDDRNIGTAKTVTIAGLTLTGANAGNYTLTQPTRTADIMKRPITVTAVTETKTYDGNNSAIGVPTLSVTTPLAPDDTAPTWTQTFDNRNVGTGKTLTPAGAIVDGNNGLNYAYTFAPDTSGAITPKAITVTAATDSKVYDGTTSSSGVPILSAGTPLAPGDTAPAWTQTFDNRNVGTAKSLTPAGKVIDGNNGLNYAYTFIPATTGIITPATLTITANPQSKAYGAADPALTYTAGGFQLGDTQAGVLTGALTRASGESVAGSPYAITQGTVAANGNYTISFTGNSLVITPAPLLLTALDASRAYGQTNPIFTASYSGFVNGETNTVLGGALGLSTIADTNSPVGTYPITASGLIAINYSISYSNGTLTVLPQALTVTAQDETKIYGATDPVFTAGYSGLVNGETSAVLGGTLAFSRLPGENVGTYLITPSGLTSTNYAITFVNGTLSIDKAVLTITADPQSKAYGAADPALTYTASGFQFSDTQAGVLTGALTRAAGESVAGSPYAITQGTVSANGNYTISFTGNSLVITPAPLLLTALDASRAYGQTNPIFTASYSGFVNGETNTVLGGALGLSTIADTNSPVGTYPITASGLTAINYSITYSNGTLTIDKAALTIAANNYTKTYGQTVTFAGTEFTPTGLVNADTIGRVSFTSAGAAPTAPLGTYDIIPSGANGGSFLPGNYQITYQNGTLTVNPAPTLLFSLQGNFLVLSWPTNATGFILETSTNLSGASTWTQSADPVHVSGTQNIVTNSISGGPAFFRLKL